MKNKMKICKKRCIAFTALLAFMVLAAVSVSAGAVNKAETNKPGAVKNLKKVKVTKNSIKVKYKKVKGAAGYQILIYEKVKDCGYTRKTPLVYAYETKKTTYTIKNLMPGHQYTVKVRAYNKDGIYGKKASVKSNTKGSREVKIICNSCGVSLPSYNGNKQGWDYTAYLANHIKSARDVHKEVHCGFVIW